MKLSSTLKFIFIAFSSFLLISLYANKNANETKQKLSKPILDLWQKLPSSMNSCPDYDYFPKGGMRNFFCHIASIPAYVKVLTSIPMSIYKSGPHKKKHLNLQAKYEFGHYNKKFVRWLAKTFIPNKNTELGLKGQWIYNVYIRPLANIYHVTYVKLKDNPKYMQQEIKWYKNHLQNKTLPPYYYERYFFFMNSDFIKKHKGGDSYFFKNGFDGGYSGNVVKTAVAFWVRRSIDGTAEDFYKGLKKLMHLYK